MYSIYNIIIRITILTIIIKELKSLNLIMKTSSSSSSTRTPAREVICQDTNIYLDNIDVLPGSVFTSLPDISEITNIFNSKLVSNNDDNNDSMNKDEIQLTVIRLYKEWFTNTVKKIFTKLKTNDYAIFLQSDVRVFDNNFKGNKVIDWIDKSHLISLAMNEVNDMKLMWHKIVTTSETTSRLSAGRPSYSHLLCYCKGSAVKYQANDFFCPDGIIHYYYYKLL